MVRRTSLALLSVALMFGLLTIPTGMSTAARTPVPDVKVPAQLDWLPEYHGQTLCSPAPKPGTLKLAALLDRTYGRYTKYFTGSPCPNGLEHQEGRAIDWMVNSAKATQKAKAQAFIAWLLAKGPNGEPGANARRLGILYLVWNNRIWGVYRQQDGWRPYSKCTSAAKKSSAYNTSCHRDHMHISMTWDGANAQTSFWSGRAETRRPCPSSTLARPGGSLSQPVVLMNTQRGVGVSAKNCRLAGDTRYTNRTYTLKVPVPTLAGGGVPRQIIKITRFQVNAPTRLKIRSAGTVYVPQNAKLPLTLSVPLRSDGRITLTMSGGHARVGVLGLGTGSAGTSVSASFGSQSAWARRDITVSGRIAEAPTGSRVILQRKDGTRWRNQASAVAANGNYVLTSHAVRSAGTYSYRVVLEQNGSTIASSSSMALTVSVAMLRFWRTKSPIQPGKKTKIRGRVRGVPDGSTLIVRRKKLGSHQRWRTVSRTKISDGIYRRWLPIESVGRYRFKVVLRDPNNSYIKKSRNRLVIGRW